MRIHTVQQGHVDWFKLRMGKVTASELGNLLTPDFEPRKGETRRTYIFEKLAEAWRGKPLIHTGAWATEQGQVREDEAIPFLALEYDWDIREGGFVESDDGLSGCSPDGLVGEEFGVEVKCPEPTAHVRYLVDGILPKTYTAQVHGSLYVTGFAKWVFCSYQRGFPPLIIEVKRDEAIVEKIGAAISKFHVDLAAARERIAQYQAQ